MGSEQRFGVQHRTQHFAPAQRQHFLQLGKTVEFNVGPGTFFTLSKNAQKKTTQTKKAIDNFMLSQAL